MVKNYESKVRMMEKKWIVVIKIVGFWIILQPTIILPQIISPLFDLFNPKVDKIFILHYIVITLLYILFGVGILRLKDWARKSLLIFQIFVVLIRIYYTLFSLIIFGYKEGFSAGVAFSNLSLALYYIYWFFNDSFLGKYLPFILELLYISLLIYFFTRPKVKEQFK